MNTEEELSNCPDCQAAVGQLHIGGCDVARCQNSGYQYISCHLREEDEYGELVPEELASHHCKPDIWDGEWPGTKDCRRLGWYAAVIGLKGESIIMPDYNRLYQLCDWNIEKQRWEKR